MGSSRGGARLRIRVTGGLVGERSHRVFALSSFLFRFPFQEMKGVSSRGRSVIAVRSHVTTLTTLTTRLRGQNEDEKE